MDDVEIVLEVEDAFDIHIDDAEAASVTTVGDLAELVQQKLAEDGRVAGTEPTICRSARTFYTVRQYLTGHLRVDRTDVRRDSKVLGLLLRNTDDIQHAWRAAESATGLRFPRLKAPPWSALIPIGAFALLWLTPWLVMPTDLRDSFWWIPLLAFVAVCAVHFWKVLPGLRTRLPQSTLGDLVTAISRENTAKLAAETGGFSEGDVWDTVRGLVCEQIGAPAEQVTRDSEFVKDLGF